MSDKGKKKHRISKWMAWSALVTFFGVIPGWIFIGGIDCAPPDDADLIISLGDKPFEHDGNGWVMSFSTEYFKMPERELEQADL